MSNETETVIEEGFTDVDDTLIAEELKSKPRAKAKPRAKPRAKAKPKVNMAKGRVTKLGDGRISKGGAAGDNYRWKDVINIPLASAEALEKRGWFEID